MFEIAYQPSPPSSAATDMWVTQTLDVNSRFWSSTNAGGPPYQPFSSWIAGGCTVATTPLSCYSSSAVIIGFNVGVGSGWNGVFTGAADDFSWTVGGVTTSTSFRTTIQIGEE